MRGLVISKSALLSAALIAYSNLTYANNLSLASKVKALSCSILLKNAAKKPMAFELSGGEYKYWFQLKSRDYALAGEQTTQLDFERGQMAVNIALEQPVQDVVPEYDVETTKLLYEGLSRYTKIYARLTRAGPDLVKLHFYYRVDRQSAPFSLRRILNDPRFLVHLKEFTYPDLDARFIDGDWTRLLWGQNVKIKLTNRGEAALENYFTKFAQAYLNPKLDLFFSSPAMYRGVPIQVKRGQPVFTVNNDHFSFEISGNRQTLEVKQTGSITFNMRTPFSLESQGDR